MTDRLVAIISTGEAAKAHTGVMYAVNALKHGWFEDVKLIFFGPAEQLLLQDAELRRLLSEYHAQEQRAVACKFIADRDGINEGIDALGVQVEYVGKMIADYIKQGFVPLIW